MAQPTRDEAWDLVCEWTQSESLRKHMLGVETAMRAYARKFGEDEELYAVTGLLHDLDYERYPDLGTGHPREALKLFEERGYPQELIDAVAGHATFLGVPRETRMAKTLYAVDELSGFISACAYVRPDGIHGMTPKSVKKKLKQPSFAAGVNRDEVREGAEELGVDFDEHVAFVIARDGGARGRAGPGPARKRPEREGPRRPKAARPHETPPKRRYALELRARRRRRREHVRAVGRHGVVRTHEERLEARLQAASSPVEALVVAHEVAERVRSLSHVVRSADGLLVRRREGVAPVGRANDPRVRGEAGRRGGVVAEVVVLDRNGPLRGGVAIVRHAHHRRERLVRAADRADPLRRAPGEASVLGLGQRHLLSPVKRASCHTTYSDPVSLSTAISGIESPVRTSWPSSGSVTPAGRIRSITIGFDHVSPLSVERITSR